MEREIGASRFHVSIVLLLFFHCPSSLQIYLHQPQRYKQLDTIIILYIFLIEFKLHGWYFHLAICFIPYHPNTLLGPQPIQPPLQKVDLLLDSHVTDPQERTAFSICAPLFLTLFIFHHTY
ncbi:hypothetical protein HD806DRAFT_277286 [Xylariaceae sp. AK1471]|nr:hypothetical protein HD806DRAFT_277286 [Xylariaceae sp. AK1471]